MPDSSNSPTVIRHSLFEGRFYFNKFFILAYLVLTFFFVSSSFNPFSSHPKSTQLTSPSVNFMVEVLQKSGGKNVCNPVGLIPGTCMDYEYVEHINSKISSVLSELLQTKFFRSIKINLDKECTFWTADDKCFDDSCVVKEIDTSTIPDSWKTKKQDTSTFNSQLPFAKKPAPKVSNYDFSIVEDEFGEGTWIDLIENPEKFTGYTGTSANQIWLSIYKYNCFGVTSVLQSLDPSKDIYPPKTKAKLSSFLQSLAEEDPYSALTPKIPDEINMFYKIISVKELLETTDEAYSPFNEKKFFHSPVTKHLLDEVKINFRNISRIMDCTGCQACKLWGKTHILGLGTSLKTLFTLPEEYLTESFDLADFKRNEIVSLIATFNQLSDSIKYITHFRNMYQEFINSYNHNKSEL
ncbi:hypothetical protein BB560_000836 [Smittium megazygosporum]|uniref:Endoplasmic reticulum oxidoreductin 1 n=1 Tax=Smittium megazygosporum TaxID=133381 RepID=A0A2T9ZJB7_9FUNG|nr:hypothetical protein BB560_000836 [Smittium megazygosporum]